MTNDQLQLEAFRVIRHEVNRFGRVEITTTKDGIIAEATENSDAMLGAFVRGVCELEKALAK